MLSNYSDAEIIGEIRRRIEDNKKALHDLEMLTKKLEAVNRKLQESEALKSNFLSNIRNEIVNPLSSIMGISDQIINGDIETRIIPEMARLMHIEAFELDFQLRNIFTAAEIEAGETALGIARMDVNALSKSVIDRYSYKVATKKLKVDFRCDSPGGAEYFFKTDPEKFQIILSNLLANAVEFCLEGKQIAVRIWNEGDNLNLSVEDEGKGIPNGQAKEIFDRFKQLESGVRKTHRGHGLGLSIVKALVDLLGGDIRMSSIVGKGTVFTVTIPEYKGEAEAGTFSAEGNEFIFDDSTEGGQVQQF